MPQRVANNFNERGDFTGPNATMCNWEGVKRGYFHCKTPSSSLETDPHLTTLSLLLFLYLICSIHQDKNFQQFSCFERVGNF